MRYRKILGLLTIGAALMAFAGSAGATITSPPETEFSGKIIATSTNTAIDGTVTITCKHSQIVGNTSSILNTTIAVSQWTYGNCNRPVSVTNPGHLFIESNGTVRSTGARITVDTSFFGFWVHCIYVTNETKLGTLTQNVDPAVWHVGSAPIPQEATSSGCGNDAVMTGSYTVEPPFGEIELD